MRYFIKNRAGARALSADDKCWCGSGKKYGECHKAEDEKLAALKASGERVPPRSMIKTPAQIEGCREAGRINSLVLDKVSAEIRAGMTTEEINEVVDSETRRLGGIPAPLGYEGFPKSVCTSVNDQICHGIPSKKVVLKEGDIINVDCTTVYEGYYGDASRMYMIGEVSERARKLVSVTAASVEAAVAALYPYCHLGDIGAVISGMARKNGYNVVRDIGGHGVGLAMHEDPYVCHIGQRGKGMILAPGMIFTIEPMINEGRGDYRVDGHDGWQVYTTDGKLSAQVEYEVLITETGAEILSK